MFLFPKKLRGLQRLPAAFNINGINNMSVKRLALKVMSVIIVAAGCVPSFAGAPAPDGGVMKTGMCAYDKDARQKYKVYVDKEGVMRRSDNDAEVSYYGTNLTIPFAHAYRALGLLGVDRKKAIDRDVYHMARLGLNAFRLHLWDAELADSAGNLLSNGHLDLLDYMLAQLEKRGIDVVLTAQTNFGNGYPERNIDTGAFTYDYEKCNIHEDPAAQKAQENYLRQLARHVNPYTGRSYAADRAIIAMEINNEPCHSGTRKQVTAYIDRMARALRKSGWDKPVLYNVSHNPGVTAAYYDADIDGTTYQWYPIGLVAGHERKGNFLPYVDSYDIPWKGLSGYAGKARLVYEFDPADILYSYMYPAIARTFRKEGFQWITQFAYDPTDMARFNTEYQTHFLNLAYTPAKAISMLIAAEVARRTPRGTDYGSYPANCRFGDFSVDGINDISMLNAPDRFYHTRSTDTAPVCPDSLRHIAGTGTSPVVEYSGTGAYFLDRLDSSSWRLEVMPDVVLTADPFAKPSLKREVADIVYSTHPMKVSLPGLDGQFRYYAADSGNTRSGRAEEGRFNIYPGVYILSSSAETDKWGADTPFGDITAATPLGNMRIGEYVAPAPTSASAPSVAHVPPTQVAKGESLHLTADVAAGAAAVDSVVVYPAGISFWNEHNTLYPMRRVEGRPYTWSVELPVADRQDKAEYSIVAFSGGRATTYPGAIPGTPLDWDAPEDRGMYSVEVLDAAQPLLLLSARSHDVNTEAGTIPDGFGAWLRTDMRSPLGPDSELLTYRPADENTVAVIRSYVEPRLADQTLIGGKTVLVVMAPGVEGAGKIEAGFVSADGKTWLAPAELKEGKAEIPLASLRPAVTDLVPAAYPTFLGRTYDGTSDGRPFRLADMQYVVLRVTGASADTEPRIPLQAIYLR